MERFSTLRGLPPASMWTRALSATATLLAVGTAQASWDATQDFATGSNPAGVWSYGYYASTNGSQEFRAFSQATSALAGFEGFTGWFDPIYSVLYAPNAARNLSQATVHNVLPGQLTLHPGPGPSEWAVLRFTAPSDGSYSVATQFLAGDLGETEAHIILNGGKLPTVLAHLGVTSVNPSYASVGISMSAGDTLDFAVGNNGDFHFDNTPLTVAISAVPEPSSAILLAAGIAAFCWRRRVAAPVGSVPLSQAC